ncbi:MAG TPA: hypothetical protein VNA25_13155, partial [Phycisphaerae bacterium]|nr:hypothetical protein [Phycisphaerae bacterium]
MKRSMIAVVGVLAVVILMGAVESSMADLTLSDGYRTDSTIQGAVRYKDLGNTGTGGDIYLGIPDLGIGGNRVEQT